MPTGTHDDDLPRPPLGLRRILLHGIGPDGARFDPLDLDFTTEDGAAGRVLLSLTNTGGKSTLITLVSSLVVPASRAQVGGKKLGDYVLTGDTSHIVCEWEDTTSGVRTVTGTVMEWKDGRRQPGHKQRSTTEMFRAWYLFRTGPGLPGIDDLPFVIDGRRAVFDRFVAAVDHMVAPISAAQWVLARKQLDWTLALEQWTSIDPVLFGYQMRMNDSEAGAEKLLATFDSPDNVVRFLIAALNDDREIAGFTSKLGRYAELVVQRPALEALNGFCAAVAPHIELIVEKDEGVRSATAMAARATLGAGEHAGALENRFAQDRGTLAQAEDDVETTAQAATTLRREYGQISDIRLQLQLEAARARLTAANGEVVKRTSIAEAAALEWSAWDAVDAVLEIGTRRAQLDSAQRAYDSAQQGIGPLREATTRAAESLAGRLDSLIKDANGVAKAADERVTAAQSAMKLARSQEMAADTRRNEAQRRLKDIDACVRDGETASARAREAGWLATTEEAADCLHRWQEARGTANQRVAAEETAAEEADKARTALDESLDALDQELTVLRLAAKACADRLDAYDADMSALRADATIQVLLGGTPDSSADVERAAELAGQAAPAADRRAAEHETRAEAARAELAYLDETGTTPAAADVLAVAKVLHDDRVGAVTGLEWIERNIVDPDARPDFIANHPEIAGGVVVSDRLRFDAALESLSRTAVRTRIPVAVITPPTSASSPNGMVGRRHVVIPHRSSWDRQWAADARPDLEQTASSEGNTAAAAREAAGAYRTVVAVCSAFAASWGEIGRDKLREQAETSTVEAGSAERKRGDLLASRNACRDAAKRARANAETARKDAKHADGRVTLAAALVEESSKARAAAAERPAVEQAWVKAGQEVELASAAQDAADTAYQAGVEKAAQARSSQDDWRRQRRRLGVEPNLPDPGGSLDVIRAAWQAALDDLSAAERGMVEGELLDRAQRSLSEARERRERFDACAWERAEAIVATAEASSREFRLSSQRLAKETALDRERERLGAEQRVKAAKEDVRNAQPTAGDRQNHVDLTNVQEWLPGGPEDIPALQVRLEAHNAKLLMRRDAAEQAEADARVLRDAIALDIDAFTDAAAMWYGDKISTTYVFSGSKELARTTMVSLLKDHRVAVDAERLARDELREAVNLARAVAGDHRWHELDAPVAVRVRMLREPDLVSEAAVLSHRISAMARSAGEDLAHLDTHRAILRDGLLSLCRDQRRLLREVSRLSRLPAGLGDLSGQPAIKIRFEDAPDDETSARLAARVDSWATELAANPRRASSSETRARWLADAVRDSVLDRSRAGAWSIEILKPRIDGRVVYCPPDRIPQEFSGGQVLTLAVLVYCALSGVRSAHRPGGARPAGTLVLDNPFGAASAEALIEMQHRLAAHTGLQLICATGLNDANVDRAFTGRGSVIIKLRNDGDLRRNLSYLRLRSRLVDGTDLAALVSADRSPDAAQNWVDAIRYEIRS